MSKIIGNTVGTPMSPKKIVDEAKTTATEAKSLAEEAKTTADEAKSLAEEVQTTATEAKTTADEAKSLIAIKPADIRKGGTYKVKAISESSGGLFEVYFYDENGETSGNIIYDTSLSIGENEFSIEISDDECVYGVEVDTKSKFTIYVAPYDVYHMATEAKALAEELKNIIIEPANLRIGGTYKAKVIFESESSDNVFSVYALKENGVPNSSLLIFDANPNKETLPKENEFVIEIPSEACKYGVYTLKKGVKEFTIYTTTLDLVSAMDERLADAEERLATVEQALGSYITDINALLGGDE